LHCDIRHILKPLSLRLRREWRGTVSLRHRRLPWKRTSRRWKSNGSSNWETPNSTSYRAVALLCPLVSVFTIGERGDDDDLKDLEIQLVLTAGSGSIRYRPSAPQRSCCRDRSDKPGLQIFGRKIHTVPAAARCLVISAMLRCNWPYPSCYLAPQRQVAGSQGGLLNGPPAYWPTSGARMQ